MTELTRPLEAARLLLEPYAGEITEPDAQRLDAAINVGRLAETARALRAARWGYLAALTGIDAGPAAGTLEALYHFCAGAAVLTLRVTLPRESPRLPSLQDVFPNAGAYERELAEMLGVEVTGLRDTSHLFLPDDWPDSLYPLRKDADLSTLPD